jgi:hypothetical protein
VSADERLLLDLLGAVSNTAESEIDCGEFLARAAAWVERGRTFGRDLSPWRDVLRHAALCPECEEEMEALRSLLDSADFAS